MEKRNLASLLFIPVKIVCHAVGTETEDPADRFQQFQQLNYNTRTAQKYNNMHATMRFVLDPCKYTKQTIGVMTGLKLFPVLLQK